jgi:Cu+-exporting ATPase
MEGINEIQAPVELQVKGMTCTNCALGVEKFLLKSSAEQVSVDFTTGEVRFQLAAREKLPQILKGIRGLGYEVARPEGTGAAHPGKLERLFGFSLIFTLPLLLHMFLAWPWLHDPYVQFALALPVWLLGLWHFGRGGWNSLRSGVANMDVLVALGSTAAFGYSVYGLFTAHSHDYLFFETAASIVSIVLLGSLMEQRAVRQTTQALRELGELQPPKALRFNAAGEVEEVPSRELAPGDELLLRQGSRIPADGEALSGEGEADESLLSGESRPQLKIPGSPLTGGALLISGTLRMRVSARPAEGSLAQIIRLVKQAQADKAPIQQLADRISAVFVPAVILIAVLTFGLSWAVFGLEIGQAVLNSVAVLVISCPCAMGLATPTAVVVGIGRASKMGILVKGGRTLEQFAGVRRIVFDKTGTLTTGQMRASLAEAEAAFAAEAPGILRSLGQLSSHPVAQSVAASFADAPLRALSQATEVKGLGMSALDESGRRWQLGSFRLAEGLGKPAYDLHLLCEGKWAAGLRLEDEVRPGAAEVLRYFREQGIRTAMLSGDRREICEALAAELGIEEVYSEQLPADKLAMIRRFSTEMPTAMVGDGINDAPALALASTGISLSRATDVARQSAQVILPEGRLERLSDLHRLSRRTLQTIRANLFWAFFYNVIAIPIAALGFLRPIVGALAMALSDVVVVGNSLRLRYRKL